MTSATHAAVGLTAALLIMQPNSYAEIVCATGGGIIGSVIADIDNNNHKKHDDTEIDDLLWGYTIVKAGILLVVDYLLGDGVCKYVLSQSSVITMTCSIIIFTSLIYGYLSAHRSYMHSVLALVFFTALIWVAFKPLTIAFGIGYLTHLLLDLTNKKGIQLLFPIKKKLCLKWCEANGTVNRFFSGFGHLIGGILVCLFILRVSVIHHDGIALITMLNRKIIGGMNLLLCYLIIINVISVIIFMSVFSNSMENYDETIEHQGIYFWFFEILCFIGGGIGIFFSMIRTSQKFGKHSATMYVYTFALIEAWSVLYMIIANPFNQTLSTIQNKDLSSHFIFFVYFALINIVLLFIVWIDRNNRHNKWSLIETIEVLLGVLGGPFLLSFVDLFCDFRGNSVFGWAFTELCVTHFFAIGYLLCVGVI